MRSPSPLPLTPKANPTFAPEGSPTISCAGWPCFDERRSERMTPAKNVAAMKCLIIALTPGVGGASAGVDENQRFPSEQAFN